MILLDFAGEVSLEGSGVLFCKEGRFHDFFDVCFGVASNHVQNIGWSNSFPGNACPARKSPRRSYAAAMRRY